MEVKPSKCGDLSTTADGFFAGCRPFWRNLFPWRGARRSAQPGLVPLEPAPLIG